MPTQEIPMELDHLLQKGGLAYWQAKNNRNSLTLLCPWAEQVLRKKAETFLEEDNWFDFIHPKDREETEKTILSNDGSHIYQVDYRWEASDEEYIWLRELGRRKSAGSQEFEGLFFSIDEKKELEFKVLSISEREKRKLGRELHDDLCQQLAGMLFFTNNLAYQIKTGKDTEVLIEATNEIKKQLQLSIEKTRCLSHGLNPVSLQKKTFQECLIELVNQSQTLYSINCDFHMSSDVIIENQEVARHLFRITQESINNSVRHGQANTVSITLQREDDFGILRIRDNGSGFQSNSQDTNGMGLHNIRSRAEMINATVEFSNNQRGGASVLCKFGLLSI